VTNRSEHLASRRPCFHWRVRRCVDRHTGPIDVIRRASRPETAALLEAPDGSHFLPAEGGQAAGSSGLMVYRFGAPLYFANATLFLDDSSGWSRSRPPPSAGSCWMRRRWWTWTRPVRAFCVRRSPC
jgi:hypothetical protein